MTFQARIRWAIKWGGTALTVLLSVVWIGSKWGFVSYDSPSGYTYEVTSGGLCIASGPPTGWSAWNARIRTTRLDLWYVFEKPGVYVYWVMFIPAWPLVALSAVAAATSWRLDTLARRREHLNRCPKCGYDRTRLVKDAACPECGTVSVGGHPEA
jgi:hypothetical protein